MKKLWFFLICIALYHTNIHAQTCQYLVWSDEFNVDGAPDPNNWGYDLGYIANNEIQTYVNSINNAYVSNGVLNIKAIKDNNGNWTSARLKTQDKHFFTYGKIEFSAKGPVGDGTWPALWMLGQDIGTIGWPACGEIDIMEEVGKAPNVNHGSIHTPSSYGNTVNTSTVNVPTFSSAFHQYAIEWTSSGITFSVDSVPYYTYSPSVQNAQTWPFANPCFIIMNLAMGGTWGSDAALATGGLYNGIDPNLTSATMQVDYVRVYSYDPPPITGDTVVYEDSVATYTVPQMSGMTYTWAVPADAQIVSGQQTNSIGVKWGATSGNISLSISNSCGTTNVSPLHVSIKQKPNTATYDIPNADSSGNILWQAVPTSGNSLSLSLTPYLQLSYDITAPANIPCIEHPLSLFDFSNYKYISLTVKTEVNNPPPVLRLDLIDNQGNNNMGQIFAIENFINDTAFHTYTGTIGSSASFDLTNVDNMKLYVDYGFLGVASSNQFSFKDVVLSQADPSTGLPVARSFDGNFTIYPNPVHDVLYLRPYSDIVAATVVDMTARVFPCNVSASGTIDVHGLAPGFYCLWLTDKQNNTFAVPFVKK